MHLFLIHNSLTTLFSNIQKLFVFSKLVQDFADMPAKNICFFIDAFPLQTKKDIVSVDMSYEWHHHLRGPREGGAEQHTVCTRTTNELRSNLQQATLFVLR